MTTLYLTEPGTVVRCRNQTLVIYLQGRERTVRLEELSLLVVLPGVQLTDVVIAKLFDSGTETIFLRQDGQFRGRLQGQFQGNPRIRLAQYGIVDSLFAQALAERLVLGKVRNQRQLLRRRYRETKGQGNKVSEAIDTIGAYILQLRQHDTPLNRNELMGIEGICARTYYQGLRDWFPARWQFTGRNRRPPLDPINALLSWGYGVLLARVFSAVVQAGLDPHLGFFHAVEPYLPNLVLDLMEEWRPVVVDQAVIAIIKADVLDSLDFEPSPDEKGIWLGITTKKLFLEQLEQRFQARLFYSPQGRRLQVNQIMLEQARCLGRCLLELSLDYEAFELE